MAEGLRRLISLYRSVPGHILVPSLLIAGGILTFVFIAGEVAEGDTRAFDEWMLKALRSGEAYETLRGPSAARAYALDLTALGGYPFISLLLAVALGFMILRRWYHEAWLLVGATIGGWLFNSILKLTFDRPRPDVVRHLVEVESHSFPSGHAMIAAVFYPTLGTLLAELTQDRRTKAYLLGISLGITVLVGSTRVLLGVHYPTDVIAGWVAGLVWAILCFLATRVGRMRGWFRAP